MSARRDLLALDERKLVTLANRGIVRRASKDLAAGRGPAIELEDDGTVRATADDVVTRLVPERPLRDTPCTCGALEVCRHRVMAVLAYQAHAGELPEEGAPGGWSPAGIDDATLARLLGRAPFGRATRRRRAGFVADVLRAPPGDVPTVELPTCTVRFLVPDGPSYARCDCAVGVECEHLALAVWAFREADARDPAAARLTVQIGARGARAEARAALEPALELGTELLLDGAVGAGAALGARFARATKPMREAKLLWPLSVCEELEETLARYAGRAARYRPERVADALTELHARARAASAEGEVPARAILGVDEPTETRLEHLRLISLGARLSQEPLDGERVRASADVFLADPDTLGVLVLRKGWELGSSAEGGPALARRAIQSGVPLGTLARGQLVTRAARRRANRLLVLGRGVVGRTSVTPQRGEWDRFAPPLFVERYADLAETLRERAPALVRPRLLAERVHVIGVRAVERVTYHAGEQTAWADVADGEGGSLRLELEHSVAAPYALDALVAALTGEAPPRYVSGEVRREGERLVMTPLAVVTDRVIALDLAEPIAARLPSVALPPARDPIHEALLEARAHLDRGAHEGLRHVGESWREELGRRSERLERVGLRVCAARAREVLERLAARVGGDRDGEMRLAEAWLDASLRIRLCLEAG